jgi:AAA family ATP:ADP antiporter
MQPHVTTTIRTGTPRAEASGMRALRSLHSWLPVQRREAVQVALLAVNVFVLLTTYYVLKVVREPLILIDGGAELKAYASAGQAGLLLLVVPAFGAIAARRSRLQIMVSVQTFFIGCLLAFYALSRIGVPIGVAFYLWVGVFNVLVVSNFWSFANDLFTQEQGKRLFGIIGLGASAGAIVGALVPRALQHVVGMFELMPIAAVGLALSTVLYAFIDRTGTGIRAVAPQPMDRSGGFGLVARDRYLRLIAVMVVLATVVNTTGEYVVGKLVTDGSATAADPEGYIESFYASYYGAVNVVSALIQGLLVARLLGGLGVRRTLFVMPVVALASWLVFFARSTVAMVRVTKTAENSFDYSLHNTVRQALFLPTSRDVKYKAKAAIDTFVFRLADVIAGVGVVYVMVHAGASIHAFAAVNLVLTVAWLAVVARTGRIHDERESEV